MDWTQIYAAEVAPVVERLAAPPPLWLWALLGAFALVGVALLVFGSGNIRLGGLVPLFMAGFIGFMVLNGQSRAELPARYRVGVVQAKEAKAAIKTDSRGYETSYTIWSVTLDVSETAHFDASGTKPIPDATTKPERLVVSEAIFTALSEGDSVTAVSYPGAEESISFTLAPDGSTLR